jgi:hypothetical protein
MTMPHRPEDGESIKQTNQGYAKGFQSDIRGGTNYLGETNVYYPSLGGSSDSVERQFHEPPYQNTPPSNTPKFVGRDTELEQLRYLLQEGNVVAITDTTGSGGVGKTELVIQYCLMHLPAYPGGICWLYPNTSQHIAIQIVEFARVQFLKTQVPQDISSLNGQVAFCWKNWCPGNTLLVIDNVTAVDYDNFKPFLPLNDNRFKVLLTTRDRLRIPSQLPLGGLGKEAAMELAGALMGDVLFQQEANFAEQLCAFMGYSPLALHLVAAHTRLEVGSC